jgi:signal transduction histidine kinase
MPGHKVLICLSQNLKSILLSITDGGGGFDMGKKQEGIGMVNIKSCTAAYSSNAEFVSFPGKR